jgi:bifunctional non-homologous end joining protein LigD
MTSGADTALRQGSAATVTGAEQEAEAELVAGVRVSNPQRVIDAASGLRKIDLVRYYEAVASLMLPHLKGRPVALVRAPEGVGGERFFQRHAGGLRIPGLHVLDARLWPGHEALIEIASVEGLVGAAQMNVVEFHGWNAASRRVDLPNRMVFDLDPGEGVTWPQVVEGARMVHAVLHSLGLRSWLKTSGSKGLHVVVPIAARWPADQVKAFSRLLVRKLVDARDDLFVATSGPQNRIGRIFVDYLRNGLGATTVLPFSARLRPGLPVSMTIAWDDLDHVRASDQWTAADAATFLRERHPDPWAGFLATRQGLSGAMKRLGFEAAGATADDPGEGREDGPG